MPEDFDGLLGDGLLAPPDGFTHRVMAQIAELPLPEWRAQPKGPGIKIQWLAVAGAALVGAAQLGAFIFGIWATTAAS